jgi:hypothetical protein
VSCASHTTRARKISLARSAWTDPRRASASTEWPEPFVQQSLP